MSGETLLVAAYVVLWLILMGWVFLLWQKQERVHARLSELEKILDEAEKSRARAPEAKGDAPAPASAGKTPEAAS